MQVHSEMLFLQGSFSSLIVDTIAFSCSLLVRTCILYNPPLPPAELIFVIPVILTLNFVSAPLSGWLAGAKFGNHKN